MKLNAKRVTFIAIALASLYVMYHNERFLIDSEHPAWKHYEAFKWWLLPHGIFGAIVLVISAIGLEGAAVNYLCTAVLLARVCQSLVHVSHVQTDAFVAVRFSFFSVQLICFLTLIVMAACHGA